MNLLRLALMGAVLVAGAWAPLASAAPEQELVCEELWIRESASLRERLAGGVAVKEWRSHQARCGDTLAWFGRLAMLQIMSNDFAGARATLDRAPQGASPYAYSRDAARIQLDVQQILVDDTKTLGREDVERFEIRYAALIRNYPNWPTGYALTGGMQTMLGKHDQAIRNLRRAAKGDAYDLSGVYRNLTISLAATGAYADAEAAADRAYELNKQVTGDPPFMIAMARTNLGLGNLEDAGTMLRLILAKKPEVRGDPEFVAVAEAYNVELARRGKK
jgi:tetratricopeptide (TPR) repeat protein